MGRRRRRQSPVFDVLLDAFDAFRHYSTILDGLGLVGRRLARPQELIGSTKLPGVQQRDARHVPPRVQLIQS